MQQRTGRAARLAVVAAALACTASAFAAGPRAVRRQVEASMLVEGRIEIDQRGNVAGYSLERQERLPAAAVELLARSVPAWRFEPVVVDGRAVNAAAPMSVRLVARKVDEDHYEVAVRGASFGREADPETHVRSQDLTPPDYPLSAVKADVSGTVYMSVKVGRDGKVLDAFAEQVNLQAVASDQAMVRWRGVLASAAIRGARKWAFAPPTRGELVGAEFWVVRVPVAFHLGEPRDMYGEWQAYVPGPRQPAPWNLGNEGIAFSPDTLAPGAAHQAGAGLKLLALPPES